MNDTIELYQNNVKLTIYVANKWLTNTPQMYHDEILSEARIGLWKACKTYDQAQGFTFPTYAVRVISNEIGRFMKKQYRHMNNVSLDVTLSDDENITLLDKLGYEHDFESEINHGYLLEILNKYQILKLLISGRTQTEIARCTGYSQAHISRLIKKERKILKTELEVLAGLTLSA